MATEMLPDPYSGNAVKCSPFSSAQFLVAASTNNLIEQPNISNGGLYLLRLDYDTNTLHPVNSYQSSTGLQDCSWSRLNLDFAVSGGNNGSLQIFDTSNLSPLDTIVTHPSPILSVDWSPFFPDFILSASTGSVELWRTDTDHLFTFPCEHYHFFNAVAWSPRDENLFAVASSDHTASIWDIRIGDRTHTLPHDGNVLSCDWSKFHDGTLATIAFGTHQCCLRVYDVRHHAHHFFQKFYPRCNSVVDKVGFSRHRESVLFSCSADSVSLWDYHLQDPCVESCDMDQGSVHGVDMSAQVEGLMVCTGTNGEVYVSRHWVAGN